MLSAVISPAHRPARIGHAPYPQPETPKGFPLHRAWVEHRRLNRLDAPARADIGLSLAARSRVTVGIIFARMRAGA